MFKFATDEINVQVARVSLSRVFLKRIRKIVSPVENYIYSFRIRSGTTNMF